MKEKEYKITFKKGKHSTGLMGVGEGTPSTEIKYRGIYIGFIDFNNSWHSKIQGIQIKLKHKDETQYCKWKWATLKGLFKNEEEARARVQELKNKILDFVYIDETDRGSN